MKVDIEEHESDKLLEIVTSLCKDKDYPLLICGVELREDGGNAVMHMKGEFTQLAMFMARVAETDPERAEKFMIALELIVLSMKYGMKDRTK